MRLTFALALLTAVLLAPSASATAPVATASKGCSIGNERGYGTTYVIKISASGTSCRAARSLIKAYHACRPGQSGKCGHVKGYTCSEKRFDKIKTQYSSNVSCRKGGKTVKHTYTQFT